MHASLESLFENMLASSPTLSANNKNTQYDPELMYVECSSCGRPIVWEKGRTSSLLKQFGIPLEMLDSACMIISNGCTGCMPGEHEFGLSIVRLAGLDSRDLALLQKPAGNA